ncbi:MAG: hypothetical protein IIB05_06050 [Bacteroidetes bacterium]|nr:hypothetical protein [Bacteroidota bacterium]
MFRKTANIILVLLLLTATIGFSVSKHYCGSRLVEVSINSEEEPCCDDMENSNCCRYETEYFQLIEDLVTPVSFENTRIADFDILFQVVFVYFFNTPGNIETGVLNYAESPPPPSIQAKLSLLQTYLC